MTLTVWDWWNPSQAKSLGDWFDWVSQSFAQKKSGTKVEFQFVPFGTEYVQKLLASFAAGNPPDAYHSSIIWARDFYDRGVLTELDAFLGQTPELAPDKFFGVSNFYRTTKGKTFGVPMEGPDSNVVLINTKIFKEAGLDPQGENIKTWDDFAETARKLTKRDASGNITQAGWLVQDWRGIEGFATWTYANGGQIQDQDQTKALFEGDNARYKKNSIIECSGNVSEFGSQTKVRVNFQTKMMNNKGEVMDVRQVDDAKYYQEFFRKVDKGIFIQKEKL